MNTNIRDLLSRATVSPEDATRKSFVESLDRIMITIAQPGVNESFRSDLLKIIASALDIVETLSSPTYHIDEVLTDVAGMNMRLSFILEHVAKSRPRTEGFGLVHRDNGRLLPNIWLQDAEAHQYVDSMRQMGALPPSVSIIPIELASRHIPRPRAIPVPAPEQQPLPKMFAPKVEPFEIPAAIQEPLPPKPHSSLQVPPVQDPPIT